MAEDVGYAFQFHSSRDTQEAEARGNSCVLEPCGIVPSKDEKDYQRLVSEKLKAAADWDFRDAKQLRIE